MDDDEGGIVVARIQIERRMMPDGDDCVIAQFDDGTDDGDVPKLVELLGMLELTKDTAVRMSMCEGESDDDE